MAVLHLSVNPIETLYLRLTVKIFQFLRLSTKFLTVLRLSVNPIETLYVRLYPTWHWCLRTFHGVIHDLLTVFCVLYRKESANKRYRNTVNNLISPNAVSQNDEKPHTAELDHTANLNYRNTA